MLKLESTWPRAGLSWQPLREVVLMLGHYGASENNSPELLAPPDPEIDPSPTELPYPEINPCPTGLSYPDGNPCAADPLGAEFLCCKQAVDSLLAQNGDTVIQSWRKCREDVMKEVDLAAVAACLVIYALSQCPAYRALDYQAIKELRS